MNYVLAVCGSVSAYKACDVLRGLLKADHEVKVILTKGATKFVRPEIFEYLGAECVYNYDDDFKKREDTILHIDLKHWLDRLVIAPASANTLAKLSYGMADDLLSSLFLSVEDKDKIIFPAMNTSMLNNSRTQDNLARLTALKRTFIHPTISGVLACGDEGEGKLPLPADIVEFLEAFSFENKPQKALIVTGATKAPLDPVRYLTNPSSGKTGIDLAKVFLANGHRVDLIAGEDTNIPLGLLNNPNLNAVKVMTTKQMFAEVQKYFSDCDYYISPAAISDIAFKMAGTKIKKADSPSFDYEWDVDILKEVLKLRDKQKIVGFAAETQVTEKVVQEKIERKPVDLLIANEVSNGIESELKGFKADANIYFFVKDGVLGEKEFLTKKQLASKIYQYLNESN